MPFIPDWTVQFSITNPYSTEKGTTLLLNVDTGDGWYMVDQSNSGIVIDVRSTKDNVPQADGSILHTRFLTGSEIEFAVQLWQDPNNLACDAQLARMLDNISGALRSMLNAGDNEGRVAWDIHGGSDTRMLDDARLHVYPVFSMSGSIPTVTFKIDSQYPYAQDLTPVRTAISDGQTVTINNAGTAIYYPVFQVNRYNNVTEAAAVGAFLIQNITTGDEFTYNDTLPGAPTIAANHYAEINCFRNTIYRDGTGANLKAGVEQLTSEYITLRPGDNDISIFGCPMDMLWANAYG